MKLLKNSNSNISNTGNTPKTSAVFTAKFIAVFAFAMLLFFCFAEVMTFASYVIPLITVSMYQLFEKIQTSDASINANVSLYTVIFPSLFLILVTSLLHYSLIKYLIKRVAKWMMGVLRQ
jgi:hypothetical protein